MIEVVNDARIREVVCPHCFSLLKFTNEDCWDTNLASYITCPACNKAIWVGESCNHNHKNTLVDYPATFDDISADPHDVADIGCDRINDMIQEGLSGVIKDVNSGNEDSYFYTATGNTFIIIYFDKELEKIVVNVCKWYNSCMHSMLIDKNQTMIYTSRDIKNEK